MRGLILIFVWMAAIGGIILLISYAMKLNWAYDKIKEYFGKEDPIQKLNRAIETQRINLSLAKQSVYASEEWVRHAQREHDRCQQDIDRLQQKIKQSIVKENEGDALNFTEKLLVEERELADCKARLKEAKTQHCDSQKYVDQFEREIRRMESKSKQLQIKSNLAEARKEASKFMAEISTGIGEGDFQEATKELQEKIADTEAKSKANERIASFVKNDDEFMDASSNNAADRLAEIKKRTQF